MSTNLISIIRSWAQIEEWRVAIFSCHFLCDIKLVSANSHLLNFSYFSLMFHSPRTFTIYLSWSCDIVFLYGNPGYSLRLDIRIRQWHLPVRQSLSGETFFKRETDMLISVFWGVESTYPHVHFTYSIYSIPRVCRWSLCLSFMYPGSSRESGTGRHSMNNH